MQSHELWTLMGEHTTQNLVRKRGSDANIPLKLDGRGLWNIVVRLRHDLIGPKVRLVN